jgi:hypothetical protein
MSEAKYSFLSWVRQGLSQYAKAPTTGSKANLDVRFQVSGTTIENNVQLYGPGDVVGLDLRNIVKVHPEPNTGNFESNYLPFIEFYQDSFLWDYTPTSNDENKLDPWLFLLVLEDGEYEKPEVSEGLGIVNLNSVDVFPPKEQRWAWGHVHVNAYLKDDDPNVDSISLLDEQLKKNPDYAVCRLMSPRKLEPNKRYEAFVIPAYEVGRKTGLGVSIENITGESVLEASWENEALTYPYYYSWSFSTGADGDFESLARALKPTPELDASIGFRPIDVTEGKMEGFVKEPKKPDGTLMEKFVLGGALKPVGSSVQDFPDTSWQNEMVDMLNLRDGAMDESNDGTTLEDPIIVPPTYGHWHAMISELKKGIDTVEDANLNEVSFWPHTLNLDLAHRASAGVGTKVIQENQDQYLATAWQQIGAVLEANQMIKNSQLGIEIAVKWWETQILEQTDSQIVGIVGPLLDQLYCKNQPIPNIHQNIENTSTPSAAFSPVFRRLCNNRNRFVTKMKKRKRQNPNILIHPNISDGIVSNLQLLPIKTVPAGKDNVPIKNKIPDFPCSLRTIVFKPENLKLPVKYFPGNPRDPRDINQPTNPNNGQQLVIDEKDFTNAWQLFIQVLDCKPNELPPRPLDLNNIMPCIENGLNPSETIKGRTFSKIGMEADLDAIIPIMAAPDYPEPMYKKLLEQSSDFILPNLDKLPNNSISLMEVNQKFIEAFMVGLNYEMAGELLWNEYPTDQRGSYFRQFWDVSRYVNVNSNTEKFLAEKLKDIDSIHRWAKWSNLGGNKKSTANFNPPELFIESPSNPLVLTIRGDLLNRYPEAIIYAAQAKADESFDNTQTLANTMYPIFSAKIEPDITFLGFNLTEEDVRGNGITPGGWFFCIKEPNTGPRFGMDVAKEDGSSIEPGSWDDLHWGHVATENNIELNADGMTFILGLKRDDLTWGSDAATMASILYQVPVLVAIHGKNLLPNP